MRKVAEEWFEVKKSEVTADYADDIWRSLELHVFNRLGETPVSQISAQTVIDVLRPVEKTGRLETVKRVIQRLNEIMNYAVIKKLITGNQSAAIKSAFKKPKATFTDNYRKRAPTSYKSSMKPTLRILLGRLLNSSY